MRPLISVITVVFNGGDSFVKTINSVLNQTYSNIEFIIIDGSSSDGTVNIIKNIDSKYKQGLYKLQKFLWISEPDKGIYDAMNKGIKISNGNYCIFINAGDFFVKNNILEKIFEQELEEDIIYSNVVTIKNEWFDIYKFPPKLTLFFWYYWSLNHQNTLIKRSLFDQIGLYNTDFKIASDYDFFIKATILENCKTRYINDAICCYDMNGISSTNQKLLLEERESVLKAFFSERILSDYKLLEKLERPWIKVFLIRFFRKITFIFRHLYIKHYIYEQ